MTTPPLRTLLPGGAFFECPRWHEGAWWVSDFYRHLVLRVGEDGGAREIQEVEGQPSGLGWMPDGSLLIASMRDRRLLRRRPDGTLTEHADVSALCAGHLNDMVLDDAGRAYVGNFGFDLMNGGDLAATRLLRVDPDGSVAIAAEDLLFPNGAVITPDGGTLIVGETGGGRYTSFARASDGSLAERRTWARIGPAAAPGPVAEAFGTLRFAPDGCCLDAEGRIWSADALNARVVRLAPGGAVEAEIAMPEGLSAFACMLGGEDGRTLLVCAAPDFLERNRRGTREGVLLTTTVLPPRPA